MKRIIYILIFLVTSVKAQYAPTYTTWETNAAYYKYTTMNMGDCRGNKVLGIYNGYLWLSEDYGVTFTKKIYRPDITEIKHSYISEEGNVMICTGNRIFNSLDNFKTLQEVFVSDTNGNRLNLSIYPDDCFKVHLNVEPLYVNGRELVVWGNYVNFYNGLRNTTPVNVFYSDDGLRSFKIAYSFGADSAYGNISLNPSNPTFCRHVHTIFVNPNDNSIWIATGDFVNECHLIRGTFNWISRKFIWATMYTGTGDGFNPLNYYKWTIARVIGTDIYMTIDTQYAGTRGVYKVPLSQIGNYNNWTRLLTKGVLAGGDAIYNANGEFLITDACDNLEQQNHLYLSKDYFQTYAEEVVDPNIIGTKALFGARRMGNGWYKFTTNTTSTFTPAGTLFVKIK